MGVFRMAGLAVAGAVALGVAQGQSAGFGPDNPFYAKSTLPYQAPAFDKIRNEDYEPALLAGMAEQTQEIRKITDNPAAPTFENTIVAMERTGELLDRVDSAMSALSGAYTNPTIEKIEEEMAPKRAAHEDAIYLDGKLFARVQKVWDERAGLKLDGESQRLLEITYQRFVHAGAKLNEADKAKLKQLNAEESTLSNAFSRKLLAATKAGAYVTADQAALAGLSEAQVASATAAAKARGSEGYALPLQNTTQQPGFGAVERACDPAGGIR